MGQYLSSPVVERAKALADVLERARDPFDAAIRFQSTLAPFGIPALGAQVYHLRADAAGAESREGGFTLNIAPQGWKGHAALEFLSLEPGPVLQALDDQRTCFRYSDYCPREADEFGATWEALGSAGISEGVGVLAKGPGTMMAVLSLPVTHDAFNGLELASIQLCGLLLLELLKRQLPDVPLTPRERDCLARLAEGRSDEEIARHYRVSETAVRFHVDNARRKLRAATRQNAIERLIAQGGL